ncbi:hypothetical protein COT68_03045, partial [bacterium (Candidatus Torokbacteria) CG09_land_8_20_14_0_10_42_11]
ARTNDLSEIFAGGLKDAGVPYVWAASRGLYKKPIIMDVLSYFNLLDNYHESPSLYRILNLPIFKIKTADLVELNYWANRRGRSLYKILEIADGLEISDQSKEEIRKIVGLIQKHSQLAREGTIANVFFGFMEDSGYLKYLGGKDNQENRDNIFYLNQFAKKVKQFETATTTRARLSDFVRRIEMEQEAGDEGALDMDLEAGPEAVKIMTIHKAKGLEFPYVFIVGMVDKRFPSINFRDPIQIPDPLVREILPSGDVHLQEERRLFYVACTRAREGLFFTSAEDYGGSRRKKLSRFLIESGMEKQLEKEVLRVPTAALDQIRKTQPLIMAGEKAEFKIPRHFSFSQFVAFSKCPLQYKFQFAIRIPKRGHYTFSFGQTMHKVMYDLFHLLQNKEKAVQKDLFGFKTVETQNLASLQNKKDSISWPELKKIFENAWIDDWYPNEKTQKEYKRQGLKQLKEFYDKHKNCWPKVRGIEKAFRLKIGEDIVIGRIDRIDEVEGGVAIVDYKTGSARELKYLARENKEQLLLYQLALQELGAKDFSPLLVPKNLSFYYFENNQAVSFLGKDKDLEKLKSRIAEIISRIKSADFTPTPGFQCKYCDFKEICEYRKL